MSSFFIGEIRMFGGNFAPQGWAFCAGQLMSIAENQALFTLIGTTYGGDGQTTFGLPDLRSRVPVHQGNSLVLGQLAGTEQVTLTSNQLPAHNHVATCFSSQTVGNQPGPGGNIWANSALNQYSTQPASGSMNPASVQIQGSSLPHDNIMPYLAVNFIISLFGVFPSRN